MKGLNMGMMLPRWRQRVNHALELAQQGHTRVFDETAVKEAASWGSCGIGEAYHNAVGHACAPEDVQRYMEKVRDPLSGQNILKDLGLQFYNAVFAQNAQRAHGLLSRMEGIEESVLYQSAQQAGNGYRARAEELEQKLNYARQLLND